MEFGLRACPMQGEDDILQLMALKHSSSSLGLEEKVA